MVVPSRFRAGMPHWNYWYCLTEFVTKSNDCAGLLQILTSSDSIFDYAGVYCVHQIAGDVRTVFDQLDTDKSGLFGNKTTRS
jgi:hypothetical protein